MLCSNEWGSEREQSIAGSDVEQAGGQVLELDGKPLSYNAKSDILNPWFVVIGPTDHDWLALLAGGE